VPAVLAPSNLPTLGKPPGLPVPLTPVLPRDLPPSVLPEAEIFDVEVIEVEAATEARTPGAGGHARHTR
jgi:hypothetical protein